MSFNDNDSNNQKNDSPDYTGDDKNNILYFKPRVSVPPLFIKIDIFADETFLLLNSLNDQIDYYEKLALSEDPDDQILLDRQEDLYFALLITRNKILNDFNIAAANHNWNNVQYIRLKTHVYEIFYLLSALETQAEIIKYKGKNEEALVIKAIIERIKERIKTSLPKQEKLINDFYENNSIDYKKNLLLEVWNKYYSSRELH